MDHLAHLRRDYAHEADQSLTTSHPFELMHAWLTDAVEIPGADEPNAIALATADPHGVPSVRMVLVKGFDPTRGALSIYTGLGSRKAADLTVNPRAAGTMWWPHLHRQLRVVGTVELIDRAEVDAYFISRPEGSQASARASFQSTPARGPEVFTEQYEAVLRESANMPATAPDHWGGYRIVPDEIEFWHGRTNRAHDRVLFVRTGSTSEATLLDRAAAAGIDDAIQPCDASGTWKRCWLQP